MILTTSTCRCPLCERCCHYSFSRLPARVRIATPPLRRPARTPRLRLTSQHRSQAIPDPIRTRIASWPPFDRVRATACGMPAASSAGLNCPGCGLVSLIRSREFRGSRLTRNSGRSGGNHCALCCSRATRRRQRPWPRSTPRERRRLATAVSCGRNGPRSFDRRTWWR